MVYGRTPFEHIRNKLKKWHAITDPSVPIAFPEVGNRAVRDIMQVRKSHVRHMISRTLVAMVSHFLPSEVPEKTSQREAYSGPAHGPPVLMLTRDALLA